MCLSTGCRVTSLDSGPPHQIIQSQGRKAESLPSTTDSERWERSVPHSWWRQTALSSASLLLSPGFSCMVAHLPRCCQLGISFKNWSLLQEIACFLSASQLLPPIFSCYAFTSLHPGNYFSLCCCPRLLLGLFTWSSLVSCGPLGIWPCQGEEKVVLISKNELWLATTILESLTPFPHALLLKMTLKGVSL